MEIFYLFNYKFPRLSCSNSMASNNDLKFPAPNPYNIQNTKKIIIYIIKTFN